MITGSQEAACCCNPEPPPSNGERLEIKVLYEVACRRAVYEIADTTAQYVQGQYPHIKCEDRTIETFGIDCADGSSGTGSIETPLTQFPGQKVVGWQCAYNLTELPDVEWSMPVNAVTSYIRPGPYFYCVGVGSCLRQPIQIITYEAGCPFASTPFDYPVYGPGGGIWRGGPRTVEIESYLKLSQTYAITRTTTTTLNTLTTLTWPIAGIPTIVNRQVTREQIIENYAGTHQAENRVNPCSKVSGGMCIQCPQPGGTFRTINLTGAYGRTSTYKFDLTLLVQRTSAVGAWTMAVTSSAVVFVKDTTTTYSVPLTGTLANVVTQINAISGLTCASAGVLGPGPATEIQSAPVVNLLYGTGMGKPLYLRRAGDPWETYQIYGREYFSVYGGFGSGGAWQRPDSITRIDWIKGIGTYTPDNNVCFPMWNPVTGSGFGQNIQGVACNLPARGEDCCAVVNAALSPYHSALDVPPQFQIRSVIGDAPSEFTGFTCGGNLDNAQSAFCGPCNEEQRQWGGECMAKGCQNTAGLDFGGCITTNESGNPCVSGWSVPCSKGNIGGLYEPSLAQGLRYQWQIRRY
ncbi:hypothetical protein UFOVP942_42 [uncultured Caudovirales phage]|uniref:Uncharacterized protein n=1 Tax=uncultured Caudovirales phage TaxID=2100421 RepID=A0A6J5PV67_9CAUD|nr:hypothetical protein UFOVP942_42 [uncultured Caudovirales phage]CAB4203350.1 hypothetical protein UFOVP1379_39 [uncultured Caudovirales phage]